MPQAHCQLLLNEGSVSISEGECEKGKKKLSSTSCVRAVLLPGRDRGFWPPTFLNI